MMHRVIAIGLLLVPTSLQAQSCEGDGDGGPAAIAADGRVLGHLPYGDAPPGDLVDAPDGFALNACQLRRDMIPDLQRLLAAAAGDPAVQGQLRALSCHRSIMRQTGVFCRDRPAGEDRSISVAPPGHSEHSTGYALDFAIRPADGCPDAEACMAATPAFRWLVAHAPAYGFEMSFPVGNRQGVKWEPWHWRWVGTGALAPGAARARFVFAKARARFAAEPAVDRTTVLTTVPIPPVRLTLPAWDAKKYKRRKK